MGDLPLVVRLLPIVIGGGLVALEFVIKGRQTHFRISRAVLLVVSVLSLAVLAVLSIDHVRFPLHLEVMEGTVLAHFERAMAGQPIYPEPAPEFVALAYNPLYYYASMPFGALFGVGLVALRVSALAALIGCMVSLFELVRHRTRSRWWGAMAVGLFAAAAGVMDMYLVTAHSDSWFLFMVVLGALFIDRERGRSWDAAGVLCLVAAFWFKQHGALFAAAGVIFVTWRYITRSGVGPGLRRALPLWLFVIVLGPVTYLLLGPTLFGPRFLYFTWTVPSQWSEFGLSTLYRLGVFLAGSYLVPAIVTALYVLWGMWRPKSRLNVIHVMAVFAGLSALMGALDGGSANNVFIPVGTWLLVATTLGVYEWVQRPERWREASGLIALFATFGFLLYNPQPLRSPPDAEAVYADLLGEIERLPGILYSPDIAEVEQTDRFYPNAHWVALDDLVRGPGKDTRNQPIVRDLLEPLLSPEGPAYILTNLPLDEKDTLIFLLETYTLETDYGERFAALSTQPGRFYTGYPRYLYRYTAGSSD